ILADYLRRRYRMSIQLNFFPLAGLSRLMGATTHVVQPQATIAMNFLEGARTVSLRELQNNDITRYQVTRFYNDQIRKSGYYNELKHIVEPSLNEFTSDGTLDTSGEHDNTVVPGLQHKYPQTGLLLVTDRCASYCRYCFRKRLVGKDTGEGA